MNASQPIEELATILRAVDAAATQPSRLEPLLATLVTARSGLFSGAILLKTGYTGSFVVAAVYGCTPGQARSWMRWPLRRLLVRMKPCRILDPLGTGASALALPFSYGPGGTERYVVLAPLGSAAFARESAAFFKALESITIPQSPSATPLSSEIPVTPAEPRIAGFALCDDLYERIAATLQGRVWSIDRVPNYRELCRRLEEPPFDIVVVDADELQDPLSAITSIHRVCDSPAMRVLAFQSGRAASLEESPVVDRLLDHDTAAEVVFKAFKGLAREAFDLRRSNFRQADALAERAARDALTPRELAEFGALQASRIIGGWGYVALLDDYGAISRAERPLRSSDVLSALPAGFLNDRPRFDVRVGDAFLDDLTDDPRDRSAISSLEPISGAIVPILLGGRHRGVLVACSLKGGADSASFEALERLAAILALRFDDLERNHGFVPEFRQESSWERLRDRAFSLDVYRSSDCPTPWRYRMVDETNGLLTMGLQDDEPLHSALTAAKSIRESALIETLAAHAPRASRFAAVIDFSTQAMHYATCGFSPPVVVNSSGPSGAVGTSGEIAAGVALLGPASRALIFDEALWQWCHGRDDEGLVERLDAERPAGMASIITLGLREA